MTNCRFKGLSGVCFRRLKEKPNTGGKRMDRLVYYFSSTEKDEKSAFTSHMGIEPPYVVEIPKYNNFLVRAVHKF